MGQNVERHVVRNCTNTTKIRVLLDLFEANFLLLRGDSDFHVTPLARNRQNECNIIHTLFFGKAETDVSVVF